MENWRNKHKAVINDFLQFVNSRNHDYILKGGTSLMECYNLDRMSEDIDFDSTNKADIFEDIYLSKCKEKNICPNKEIKNHFWKNCVQIQGYEPQYCGARKNGLIQNTIGVCS